MRGELRICDAERETINRGRGSGGGGRGEGDIYLLFDTSKLAHLRGGVRPGGGNRPSRKGTMRKGRVYSTWRVFGTGLIGGARLRDEDRRIILV